MALSISFEGMTVLVTGGTSGIGAATAIEFGALGAKVYAVGLGANKFDTSDYPNVKSCQLDVTDSDAVSAFIDAIERLDVVVNAAGISITGREHDPAGFRAVLEVNLHAVMLVSTLAHPLLAKQSGSIVNIASMYSTFGAGDRPAYAASKGAIVQLTKSLAQSYAPDGVRVNAVAPGWIDTPLLAPLKADTSIASQILARTPLGRFGEPAEIAKAIAFLASPLASFITGATVPVDGGYLTV
jgi:NAD(P)-dependent dehydrogenase (short-subunit alcohol dehydrogenase family)